MPERRFDTNAKVYLVGGGIASLAAAAFLIRDGDILGHNITILEELEKLGGSLDGCRLAAGRLRHARRADAREQVSLHLRPLLVDPHPRCRARRSPRRSSTSTRP